MDYLNTIRERAGNTYATLAYKHLDIKEGVWRMYNDLVEKMNKMSVVELGEALAKLRELREQADAAFLCFMFRVEQTRMADLSEAGYESFERFVESGKYVNWARYTAFKQGLEKLGEAKALELGVEVTIGAGKVTSQKRLNEYEIAAVEWTREHHGMRPSSRTVQTELLNKVDPKRAVPGPVKRASELTLAKQRIHELEVENKHLRREVAKLEKALSKYQPQAAE